MYNVSVCLRLSQSVSVMSSVCLQMFSLESELSPGTNGDKRGQMGFNGDKWGQMGTNGDKWGQMGTKWKKVETNHGTNGTRARHAIIQGLSFILVTTETVCMYRYGRLVALEPAGRVASRLCTVQHAVPGTGTSTVVVK